MTEAATKRLIADEIKPQLLPNGAIHDVIKNEILKSTQLGGVVASALDQGVSGALNNTFSTGTPNNKLLIDAISATIGTFGFSDALHPNMVQLQKDYPWLRVLLHSTPEKLELMKVLRSEGWSYLAIGNEVLMSRERVSSICKLMGWS